MAQHLSQGLCDQSDSGEDQEKEDDDKCFQRKGPSLASILGPLPTAASLGLDESITECIGEGQENGELKRHLDSFLFLMYRATFIEFFLPPHI